MVETIISAYDMGLILFKLDELDYLNEPQIGDYDYDYGYADDGWPIPPPCPICGVLYGACTTHYQ